MFLLGIHKGMSGPPSSGQSAVNIDQYIPDDKVITVGDMNNNCIMMFMAAQPPGPKSKEAKALVTYVTSLSNKEPVEVGKTPPMMKGGM